MLRLLPATHGNRPRDAHGNAHARRCGRGREVLRDPGRYTGRHRADRPPGHLVRLLARLAGESV